MDKMADRMYLYNVYLRELELYMGKFTEPDDEQEQWALDQYHDKEHNDWLDIVVDDEVVGFLIVSFDKDGKPYNCHPDCDYWISNAFVLPEYRKKGLMSSRLEKYIKRHPGDYGLFVAYGNPARSFWVNRFNELGFVQNKLADVGNYERDKLEMLGFSQKNKKEDIR